MDALLKSVGSKYQDYRTFQANISIYIFIKNYNRFFTQQRRQAHSGLPSQQSRLFASIKTNLKRLLSLNIKNKHNQFDYACLLTLQTAISYSRIFNKLKICSLISAPYPLFSLMQNKIYVKYNKIILLISSFAKNILPSVWC